jgi:hypothetical protein
MPISNNEWVFVNDSMQDSWFSTNKRKILNFIIVAIAIVVLALLYALPKDKANPELGGILSGVETFIPSIIILGIFIVVQYLDNVERNEGKHNGIAIALYIIAFIVLFNLLNLLYDVQIYPVSSSYSQVKWSINVSILSLIAVPILLLIQTKSRTQLIDDFKIVMDSPAKSKWATLIVIVLWLGLVIGLYFLYPIISSPTIRMIVVSISLFVIYFTTYYLMTSQTSYGKLEILPLFLGSLIISIGAPLIINYVIFRQLEIMDQAFFGSVIQGFVGEELMQEVQAQSSTNYFSYVFYILLQSPIPSIMIGFMVFGAISTMMIQNVGPKGQMLGAVASSIVVIIPMVFIFAILSGSIPPPEILSRILGYGTASLVFALAQLSAFILVLAIIIVFIVAGRMLASAGD